MAPNARHPFQYRPLWWLGQAALVLMGGFFLVLGVQLLLAAYELPDPFTFIMTFFAACLIILISATLLIGFFVRLYSVYRYLKAPKPPGERSDDPGRAVKMDPEAAKPTNSDVERPAEFPER